MKERGKTKASYAGQLLLAHPGLRDPNFRRSVILMLAHDPEGAVGVVLNPAAYTTTAISFLDTILAIQLPVIEVHISNIHAREEFRHNSYVSKVARGVICGFGIEGYGLAIDGLAAIIKESR